MKNLISLFVFSILTLNIVSIETIEAKTKFRFIVGNWVSQNEHVVHADIKINDLRIRHIERIENTDCVKGKQEFLEILGPINPDTHEVVKRLLNSFDKCYDKTGLFIVPTIYLDSGGGYLRDGFKLGRVLKNYKTKIFRYNPNPRKYRITPFKNNKYLIFSESYHKNKELYRITDYFSHKCRVRCVMNMAEKESILALFTKNKIAMLEEFERKNTPLTIHQMNEYLFRKFKDCTSFNTTMVMNILNLFKPRRWLDCSAGWGDRLVGAIAFDCEYLGVDPSKCMTPVYQEIIKGLVKSADLKPTPLSIERDAAW